MGAFSSKSIKVATANYSGITNSPFEFYSENTAELTRLNQIFKELFTQIPLLRLDKVDAEGILRANTNYKDLIDRREGGKQLLGPDGKSKFKWSFNNIEKSIQKGRYCAQYREDAGVQNCCFLKAQDFFKRWELQFTKNIKYVKVNEPKSNQKPLRQQKEICKIFDFLVFKTFVEYSYEQVHASFSQEEWMKNHDKRITINDRDTDSLRQTRTRRKHAVTVYETFMDKYHRKPYLKHELKFKQIKTLLETHDVVFIQDSCDQLINEIKNQGDYTIIEQLQDRDCYIIIKNTMKKFNQIYDAYKFMREQNQDELFRKNSFHYSQSYPAICLVDRFLFLSIHLSSRAQKKYEQLIAFMDHMVRIHKKYRGQLQIVVGGDFNLDIKHFMNQEEYPKYRKDNHRDIFDQFSRIFFSYPQNKEQRVTITTRKKRTWLQSQANKADVPDEKSRDFLISNFQLRNFKLINNGTNMNDDLPTDKHPFDHFFISAEIGQTASSRK